jgi:putative phosphoesterase
VKLGIVSDVHCNIAGLERAVELMGDVDELLCLGDSVFEYRFSNDVIGFLRDREAHVILGNHDEVLLGPHGARARSNGDVNPDLVAWLAERPFQHELRVDRTRILMVHSTPFPPYGAYVTPSAREMEIFGKVDADVVLYGHTHQQVVRRIDDVLVVNPGSAGDGRDHRNDRQLSFAVLDTGTLEVSVTDFPDPRFDQD